MERMRQVAFQTVQRACLFGALAIFCLMVGLSFELAARVQGRRHADPLMAAMLLYKAREARTKPYRKTEMWLYLPQALPAAGGLCAMGERHGAARDLSEFRAVDLGHRGRHVGDRARHRCLRAAAGWR